MSTLDKNPVRGQVEKVKNDFEQLRRAGKVTAGVQAVMSNMLMLVELILAIFMERTTKKNSGNSSIPPSQIEKDNSSLSDPGSKGKGNKPGGVKVRNRRTCETVTIASVDHCDVCGADLGQVACTHERRTKIDIVFEKVVEHVDAEIKQCPSCVYTVRVCPWITWTIMGVLAGCDARRQARSMVIPCKRLATRQRARQCSQNVRVIHGQTLKGKFPSDMPGPLQYGIGVQAFIINLLVCQMVALKRAQTLLYSIIDVVIAGARPCCSSSCACMPHWKAGRCGQLNNC